jgi:hypothetical protein
VLQRLDCEIDVIDQRGGFNALSLMAATVMVRSSILMRANPPRPHPKEPWSGSGENKRH